MTDRPKYRSPFLRYDGPVLLPAIRIRRPQPPAPWLHLVRPGGPPLSLSEKLESCVTIAQLEDLWAGAQDAQNTYGVLTITPEDRGVYYDMKRTLT